MGSCIFENWTTPCIKDDYSFIIPAPHHYAYFVQFDLLEKKFYTSINSMSRNLGTIFFPPVPKMCNDVDKNKIFYDKIGITRNIFVDFIDFGESLTNFT